MKESLNGSDAGGLDLTGLDALELDIAHDGPNPIQGRIYAHLTPSSVNTPLGDITIAPGGIQTVSVSLAGLSPRWAWLPTFCQALDGYWHVTIEDPPRVRR